MQTISEIERTSPDIIHPRQRYTQGALLHAWDQKNGRQVAVFLDNGTLLKFSTDQQAQERTVQIPNGDDTHYEYLFPTNWDQLIETAFLIVDPEDPRFCNIAFHYKGAYIQIPFTSAVNGTTQLESQPLWRAIFNIPQDQDSRIPRFI